MPAADAIKTVGVIGTGSFGTAIANLLSRNTDVLVYNRKEAVVAQINNDHTLYGVSLSPRIKATTELKKIAENCSLLFPIVPAENLRPYHILIHGAKGFDVNGISEEGIAQGLLRKEHVHTLSQVITQESVVRRVGCLSGPNLAGEIMEGQPTATVIGSLFDEVIQIGKKVLTSDQFHVFGNHDILGAELAGALKNVIAIGSGILRGKGLGKNIQAMLITRGLIEMVRFGKTFGATSTAFFGVAGIGDLVATATSKNSRNFTFGYRLGQGETIEEVKASMPELAEGVRTLQITWKLAEQYHLRLPITQMLYEVVFENFNIDKAIKFLITYPYDVDVDFL